MKTNYSRQEDETDDSPVDEYTTIIEHTENDKGFANKFWSNRIYWLNTVALFILGTINNLCYVVVGASSQDLASYFHQEGLAAQLLNAFFLQKVPHSFRLTFASMLTLVALIGITLAFLTVHDFGFWIAISGIMGIGAAATFGEIVILGYLKIYGDDMISGFSSGTGMAGVAGTVIYIFLGVLDNATRPWNMMPRYFILIPSIFVYLFVWFFFLKPPKEEKVEKPLAEEVNLAEPNPNNYINQRTDEDSEKKTIIQKIVDSIKFFIKCLRLSWWRSLNLVLVYWFEYIQLIGCANHATKMFKSDPRSAYRYNWFERNSFRILQVCYQIGVLISRSSLQCIKIRQVWIITVVQTILLFIWMAEAIMHFMSIWVMFPLMIVVGLMGGASYVNVFYLLLNDSRMTPAEREFSVNLCSIGVTFGITASSVSIILLDKTLFAWIEG